MKMYIRYNWQKKKKKKKKKNIYIGMNSIFVDFSDV